MQQYNLCDMGQLARYAQCQQPYLAIRPSNVVIRAEQPGLSGTNDFANASAYVDSLRFISICN